MVRFAELRDRLVARLRDEVRSGQVTERGLARRTGISQPHVHNVLKGKKSFSIEMCDTILRAMKLDLVDLLDPADLNRLARR